MVRPGHHRPIGTVTVSRFPEWTSRREPQLGDIAMETDGPEGSPDDVARAYEIVGVVETKTGFRLHMERVEYGALPASLKADAIWTFYKIPRRAL